MDLLMYVGFWEKRIILSSCDEAPEAPLWTPFVVPAARPIGGGPWGTTDGDAATSVVCNAVGGVDEDAGAAAGAGSSELMESSADLSMASMSKPPAASASASGSIFGRLLSLCVSSAVSSFSARARLSGTWGDVRSPLALVAVAGEGASLSGSRLMLGIIGAAPVLIFPSRQRKKEPAQCEETRAAASHLWTLLEVHWPRPPVEQQPGRRC